MRIGVIGLGFMGTTHLQAWRKVAGAEIVAVCSDEPEKLTGDLSAVKGNLGGSGEKFDFSQMGRYTEVAGILADENVQAVDICLPTHLHGPVATAALQAGKHVLVEKPIALVPDEADAMVALARSSGLMLMVGQVLRFLPQYRALAEAVRSGEYGPVRSAMFRRRCAAPFWSTWLGNAAQSGGGVVDLLIHDIDFVLSVFGSPVRQSASGFEDMANGVDTLHAVLGYGDGLEVVVTGGWHHRKAYPFSMEFTVVCEGGTFEFSSGVAGGALTLYGKDGEARLLPVSEQDGFEAELTYFHECCSKGEAPLLCPPEDSAKALRLALELSAERGKA